MALRSFTLTVAAGSRAQITGPGNNIIIEEFSASFEMRRDGWEVDSVRARGKFPSANLWRLVTFINLSSDTKLTIRGWVGVGDMDVNFNANPSTVIVGATIDLNAGQTQVFNGVDSSGRRRKQFTLTIDPAYAAAHPNKVIRIYNDDTDALLHLVGASSAGGGIAFETDDNLRIENGYAQNISSADGEIAVAEEFYR